MALWKIEPCAVAADSRCNPVSTEPDSVLSGHDLERIAQESE